MFRKRQADYQSEQNTQICLIPQKQDLKSKKLLRKMEQFNSRVTFEDFIQQSQFLGQFKAPFHIEFFQEQKQLDDNCILNLSNALQICKPNKNLRIDLTKMWHLDQSDVTDQAVQQLSYSLSKFNKIEQLNLSMHGWGYWNQNITNSSLKYLGQALWQKDKLSECSIDLNMWAYENQQISDEGASKLLEGLGALTQLGKLELNMKGWGETNTSVTDDTIIAISNCLNKLINLSEIKLILWDNISRKAIKYLNTTLSNMEHLNHIDLRFESSSTIQRNENHNKNAKLAQIKLNAQQKRKLLFQTEAIVNTFQGMVKITRLWNIAIKL